MPPEADAAEIFAYLLVSNSDKLEQQMIAALSAFNGLSAVERGVVA
jgi:hypothetical protein